MIKIIKYEWPRQCGIKPMVEIQESDGRRTVKISMSLASGNVWSAGVEEAMGLRNSIGEAIEIYKKEKDNGGT